MKRSNTNRGQSSSKSKYGRGNFDEDDGNTRKFVPADGSVKMEQSNSLSLDERNKLAAKILKAEMKGDMALIEKLKKKLAGEKKEVGNVILMKVDERTGLVTPACKSLPHSSKSKETIAGIFGKEQDFSDMLAEEKMTSASDQITMFERSTKVMGSVKTDDDHTIDDNLLIHPTKKYHAEKDARKLKQQNVKEHKKHERTVGTCTKCTESTNFSRGNVVAVGLKTYLAVVSFDGLDAQHCYIAPSQHYSSTVTLDEDVADEMKRWRTALVAMFKAADMDCVFFETAKNVKDQMHMSVECVPLPVEEGDMAPIFFKKAMTEVGSEWNTQKKFIDLAKEGSVRKVLPKGFSYFAVDFGLQPGFCHVIDDESTFPSNFAHEIIGGMLDVDDSHWRKMVPQPLNELNKKVLAFKKKFDDFDWTKKE